MGNGLAVRAEVKGGETSFDGSNFLLIKKIGIVKFLAVSPTIWLHREADCRHLIQLIRNERAKKVQAGIWLPSEDPGFVGLDKQESL